MQTLVSRYGMTIWWHYPLTNQRKSCFRGAPPYTHKHWRPACRGYILSAGEWDWRPQEFSSLWITLHQIAVCEQLLNHWNDGIVQTSYVCMDSPYILVLLSSTECDVAADCLYSVRGGESRNICWKSSQGFKSKSGWFRSARAEDCFSFN